MANRKDKNQSNRISSGNDKSATPEHENRETDIFADFFAEQAESEIGQISQEDQKRQWISDQIMWETTLGVREDEAVDKVISPKDRRKPTPPKQPRTAPEQKPRTPTGTATRRPVAAQRPKTQRPAARKPAPQPSRPAPRQVKAGDNAPPRTNQPVRQREVKPRPQASVTVSKAPVAKLKTAQRAATQNRSVPDYESKSQPVDPSAFDARQVHSRLDSHDVFDGGKERRLKAFALKHGAIVGVAIASFIGGYITGGGIHTPDDEPQVKVAKLETAAPAEKSKPVKTTERKPKPRPKTKPLRSPGSSPSMEQKRQTVEPAPNLSAQPLQQFEGRDIPLTEEPVTADIMDDSSVEFGENSEPSYDPLSSKEQTSMADFIGGNEVPDQSTEPETVAAVPEKTTTDSGTESVQTTSHARSQQTDATGQPESPAEAAVPAQRSLESLLEESLDRFENRQWQAVIDLNRRILEIDPTVSSALVNRAVAYTELGRYEFALNDCARALELNPDNALAINNRGYVYEKMGNTAQAIIDYNTACSMGIDLSCKEAERLKTAAAASKS